MTRCVKRCALFLCAVALNGAVMAQAQDNINARALEDIKTFLQKAEEGDTLFNQKKYAEAAAALAAAHAAYQRAERRDIDHTVSYKVTLKPETFPALRYYGYGMGSNASLTETVTGAIEGTAAGMHMAALQMWGDAAILGNLEKGPRTGALSDPPIVELDDEALESAVGQAFGAVSHYKLPVRDDEWREVVLMSRRAQLLVEYALQKHPEWKTTKHGWGSINGDLEPTGAAVQADLKAKLAEAEPEYAKLVADFKKAEPKGVADTLRDDLDTLNRAIAGVKQNGWVEWALIRDVYLTKDYMAGRRKRIAPLYAAEGKTMPADKMKPVEEKVAELKSAIEQNAPRWKFPAGKPHDAAIEARAKAAALARYPGATVLKTALDDQDWRIVKNDLGLPRYRTRDVLVLVQIPGQKWPWLILGPFDQTYSGGGTYNPGGTVGYYSQARIQTAN